MEAKYYLTWEDYKKKFPELEERPAEVVAPKLQSSEDLMFNFIVGLLM
ncbi:MAG TPA: hypothetical protein GX699_06245 [Firmicutes bacterium]|nr:hypothetical protein [Bacillota bacterium]